MTEPRAWERFFDAHAPIYDDNVFTRNTLAEVDFLLAELALPPGAAILDVGCGTGRHAVELARRGYAVTGLDLSAAMLARAAAAARAANVQVEWIRADATRFDLPPRFDAAICLCEGAFGLLSQGDDPIDQPLAILANISRSLRPGARAMFTVLNGAAMLRRYRDQDVAAGRFDPLALTESTDYPPREGLPPIAVRERAFVPTELRLLFSLAGLSVLQMGGGTAGDWGRRPLDLDEMEILVVAERTREPRSSAGHGGAATGEGRPAAATSLLASGRAPVNGITMYYEVHGRLEGTPLVLLHGGGSTIDVTFGRVLPVFARCRRVIALEEQGHGRTSDRDAPVTFETSADDVAALLRHLEVDRADILGFSNGASVGLQLAIRHPRLVRKLVFASSLTRRDGARPEFWERITQAEFGNMPQPLKDAFLRVNPDARQLEAMHDKDAARMRNFADVPESLAASVRAPALIILGDRDIVKPEHALELARLIPGARLLILPGGHGDYLGEIVAAPEATRYPELTAQLIEDFLDAP